MSENRGMAGSRSNANLPSTQGAKSPDGINKPDKSSFNRIDTKTIKDMMMINKKFSDEVMRMFGTLNGFKESIEKATDENMKVIKSQKDKTEKMNDELNALIEEFGENNIVVKKYRESMTEEITKMKNETMEIYDKSVKDFMKQSFKNESESKQISYLDNKFAKNNNLAKVSNDYYSDLEKLNKSAYFKYLSYSSNGFKAS